MLKSRNCLPCTQCCTGTLSVRIEEQSVGYGNPCKYCKDGCSIHDNQPETICSSFECMWLTHPELPDDMRPDLSGVIMLENKYFWMNRPVDMAMPTGIEIPPRTLRFIQHYSDEENRPLLYCERAGEQRKMYAYGSQEFQEDIGNMVKKGFRFI